MFIRSIFLCAALLPILLPFRADGQAAPPPPVLSPGFVRLPGHVPDQVKSAVLLGHLPSVQQIHLALALPLHNQDDLADLITHLYTPGDPLFGHYLTSAQTTARFGPPQVDYDAVRAFAEAHGLTVTHTYSNRALLDVAGPVAAVEAAFGVHLLSYQNAEGRIFYAPDRDPVIPTALRGRLSGIIGLDNANPPHPAQMISKDGPALPGISPALTPAFGNGPRGGLTPSDIKTAYNLNGVPVNGSGQVLGLMELDRYAASDITGYENGYGLPAVALENIGVNGFNVNGPSNSDRGGQEVALDIEMEIALAPGMTKLEVYEGNNTADVYNQIASDNTANEISASWDSPEPSSQTADTMSENNSLSLMAIQGQSNYASSGDNGVYANGSSLSVNDPTSQPYMPASGGTTLATNTDGTYASETAWSEVAGGISGIWSIPAYQSGFISSTSLGSTTQRNVPDVSLDADPYTGYSFYADGGFTSNAGTSASSPLWAAFAALVNQQRVTNGLPALGFANPALYALAGGPDYNLAFHDIADGGTNGYYPAVGGYDDVTGLGTFNGANLFSFLTGLYADEGFGGTQYGTLPNPYATITNANNAAPGTPVNLYIEGGDYNEQLTISKPITLINYGNGLVSIGN